MILTSSNPIYKLLAEFNWMMQYKRMVKHIKQYIKMKLIQSVKAASCQTLYVYRVYEAT